MKLVHGKNATLDHFIPLSRGGINQRLNIVPLCKKCNKEKSNKVVGTWWLKYLNKKDLKILSDYVDSYIGSFDYLTRGNLLAYDMYGMRIYMGPELVTKNKAKREKIMEYASKEYMLERIRGDEETEEASLFYIDYLKKYDILENEGKARKEIDFWGCFGAIYCLRDREGKIQVLIPITMAEDSKKEHRLLMWIFAAKSDRVTGTCVHNVQNFFSERLMSEQNLPYIRSEAVIPSEDNAKKYLEGVDLGDFCVKRLMLAKDIYADHNDEDVPFYKKFHDVRKHLDGFFANNEELRYLGEMIFEDFNKEN